MDDNELRKLLDAVESASETLSQCHPEPCEIGEGARTLRNNIRSVKEKLFGGQGPSQIATRDYRTNWETIFGVKQVAGEA